MTDDPSPQRETERMQEVRDQASAARAQSQQDARDQAVLDREMRSFEKASQPTEGIQRAARVTSSQRREEIIQRHSTNQPPPPPPPNAPRVDPPRLPSVPMKFYCYVQGEIRMVTFNCLHDDQPI